MHDKGILHNDLHGKNILLRPTKQPCIIDFGKATLASHPLIYNVCRDKSKREKYNKFHPHLAYELRNVPNTPQSFLTDVYSLGYNVKNIGRFEKIEMLVQLSRRMCHENPMERYSLDDSSVFLLKD